METKSMPQTAEPSGFAKNAASMFIAAITSQKKWQLKLTPQTSK